MGEFLKLKFSESPLILGIFYAAVQSDCFYDVITIRIKTNVFEKFLQ